MLLIFRLMTAAGWNDVLEPLMIAPPDCDPNYKGLSNGNCGNYWVAVVYFYSFIIIIFLVLINMYVAVILENYNNVIEQEKIGITGDDIDLFYAHWMMYDPDSTQYIYYRDLSEFLHSLQGNLGIRKPNKAACALLNIPLFEDDKIYCLHLLQALVRRVVTGYEEFDSEEFNLVLKRMEERFRDVFPAATHYRQTNSTLAKNREFVAARIITRAVRRYRERKRREALGINPESTETVNNGGTNCNGFTTMKRSQGSRIADLLVSVHGNSFNNSLPNLSRTIDRRVSLESAEVTRLSGLRGAGTINRSFEEDGKGAPHRRKIRPVVPNSQMNSLPNLAKTKRSSSPKKAGTPPSKSPLSRQTGGSSRVAIMRPVMLKTPPLKKIKVMEQPRIDNGSAR